VASGPFSTVGAKSYLREGTIIVQDENGNDLVLLGRLDDGSYGIELRNSNGAVVFRITSEGQTFPYAYMAWTSVASSYGFTSAAYTEIFRCDFSSIGPTVYYDVQADPSGGTMDFRIRVTEAGGTYVDALEIIDASGQYAGNFGIPPESLVSGTDPQGRQMSVRIEGRRTSGAGTPTLRLNAPLSNTPAP
jgi:hypothetical protein